MDESAFSFSELVSSRRELYLPKSACIESTSLPELPTLFQTLKVPENVYKPLLTSLAAIYHLRIAGARLTGKRWTFVKPEAAHKACALMGITEEELAREMFTCDQNTNFDGCDNLYAFISGFYGEIHQKCTMLVNDALGNVLKHQLHHADSYYINIYDTPGLKHQTGKLTLNDLITNYMHDRVHKAFLDQTVYKHNHIYQEEEIAVELDQPDPDQVHHSIKAIDTTNETVNSPPNGLFSQLEYASLLASSVAGNEGFQVQPHVLVQRIINAEVCKNGSGTLNSCTTPGWLKVGHGCNGSWPLEYDITEWSKKARVNPITYTGWRIFEQSKKPAIERLFKITGRLSCAGSSTSTAIGGMTIAKKTMTRSKALRKNSALAAAQHASQVIVDTLEQSSIYSCVVISANGESGQVEHTDPPTLDVPFVRRQTTALHILQVSKAYKQGYPETMLKSQFMQRYAVTLANHEQQVLQMMKSPDEKSLLNKQLSHVLEQLDVNHTKFKLGNERVLFRAGTFSKLESKRSTLAGKFLVKLQARCRGHIARSGFEKRKVEAIAAKCIQRNVRSFVEIKKWQWWKLYSLLLPIVEASKADIELRSLQVSRVLFNDLFMLKSQA